MEKKVTLLKTYGGYYSLVFNWLASDTGKQVLPRFDPRHGLKSKERSTDAISKAARNRRRRSKSTMQCAA